MINKEKELLHQKLVYKANKSIDEIKDTVKRSSLRSDYHFMAPAYWINDPNGLIYFKGEYHLFYQYNPYGPLWGAMHWGHAKSKDLTYWKHLPIALAPSEEYDNHEKGGCFSGSAVDDNGVLTLIYTGTVLEDSGQRKQTQCIATSIDEVNFTKYSGNPVIDKPPIDGSAEFRDPKVWKYNKTWYMVVGSSKDGIGKVLLYKSLDLRQWDYIGVMAEGDGTRGRMWECPDIFILGDKYVILLSPIEMGDNQVIYMVGDLDYESGKFIEQSCGVIDWGFDFYAPQTLLDDRGRRVMIAWMNSWKWMPWFKSFGATVEDNWCGIMSIPRVLSIDSEGYLISQPIEELKSLREEYKQFKNIEISEYKSNLLEDFNGNSFEIIAEFDLSCFNAEEFGFKLRCSYDGKEKTYLKYNLKTQKLIFDRNNSDEFSEGIREAKIETDEYKKLKMHIFIDRTSIEVFINEGKIVMSNNIYPSHSSKGLEVFSYNGSIKITSLEIWQLKSIW